MNDSWERAVNGMRPKSLEEIICEAAAIIDTTIQTKMSALSDFDFSNWDFPADRIWYRIPQWEMILKISTFVPIILFGLFGNYIIIRLIVLNRSLRTPTNVIVANMAVADFLTLLICPALFMVNDFYQNYQLGSAGCKMEGFLDVGFLVTAVLNLSVVSYDRLTAIALPLETRLTMRGSKIVIFSTWLAGFLIALPLALYRNFRVRQWKNFREAYCKENTQILPKYWYVLITVMVWLPLGVMLICYSAIFIKLDRYEKRVLNREHPLTVSYKKTVAKTLFIVVIVFIVLRLPFTILVILRGKYLNTTNNMADSSYRIWWYTAQYLMFLNAAVNPLIYGFNNDNFRRAYDQTPLFNCCRRLNTKPTAKMTTTKPPRVEPKSTTNKPNNGSPPTKFPSFCGCSKNSKEFPIPLEQNFTVDTFVISRKIIENDLKIQPRRESLKEPSFRPLDKEAQCIRDCGDGLMPSECQQSRF